MTLTSAIASSCTNDGSRVDNASHNLTKVNGQLKFLEIFLDNNEIISISKFNGEQCASTQRKFYDGQSHPHNFVATFNK